MSWIAIRMLTGARVKFIGLLFGVAFSTLLITQQLTIFVNLLLRGAASVQQAAPMIRAGATVQTSEGDIRTGSITCPEAAIG